MPKASSKERLYLFDTTLRDGAETQGIDFSAAEKRRIAATLDDLGIDYVEGGDPSTNDTDAAFFAARPNFKHARFTAYGRTKRAGRALADDPGFRAVLQSKADAICLVAKAWDYHVRVALGISRDENIRGVIESVKAVRGARKESLIDCEHFFDGYKSDRAHALAVAEAAHEAGARWVVLCDTNGGASPGEVSEIVRDVARRVPGTHLGIHTHDDTGQAVANTLAAVRAGCRQIQGALNGLGARCGNANLTSIIPTLMLNGELADRFEIGVTAEKLRELTHASRVLDEILKSAPCRPAPDAGGRALATSVDRLAAILETLKADQRTALAAVGDRRHGPASDQKGTSGILSDLERLGIRMNKDDPRVAQLRDEIKAREALGYAYGGADASFELLARRLMGEVPQYFSVDSFRVIVEQRQNAHGRTVPVSEASVRVFITGDNEPLWSVAEGHGPVNALDQALRKDLGRYQRHVEDVELVDYKVRILTGGSEAVTRVVVESRDRGSGERWSTVGVSPNIVDASFEALVDSINYQLMKANAVVAQAVAS
jgi:2-isopropylmalate synthase